MQINIRVLIAGSVLCLWAGGLQAADPGGTESAQILDSFLAASRVQRDRLQGSTAEVSIDADVQLEAIATEPDPTPRCRPG